MSKREHTLWVAKYRPTDINQYIGNEEIVENVKGYIRDNDIPHLLFMGPAGTGKTTLAKLIYKNLDCDYLFLNASDENGIDTIREKIKSFAGSASFKPLKIVVLDEADFLTQPAQMALRNVIEEFELTTRFILTCNYETKIIPALKSRCEPFKVIPPSKGDILKHLTKNVLDIEKVKYELTDIVPIINKYYPDVRSMIKKLQSFSKPITSDKFVYELIVPKELDDTEYSKELIQLLKKRDKNAWKNIRQLIINQQLDDYQPLYRFLYDSLSEYVSEDKEANIVIILDEAIWHSTMVFDKEIAMAATIAKILNELK